MIKKRPLFAVGQSLVGLPMIGKVLYSDGSAEIYELGSADDNTRNALVVCKSTSQESLRKWLSDQPNELIQFARIVDAGDIPSGAAAALVTITGRSLDGNCVRDDSDSELRALFGAIIAAVERSRAIDMFPDLNPFFIVMSPGNQKIGTLIPSEGSVCDEPVQVSLVTKAFCTIATGVTPPLEPNGPYAFQNWAKFASTDLARVVDRCLQGDGSKAAICTFAALKKALGDELQCACDLPEQGGAVRAGVSGLDRVAGMHTLKKLLREQVIDPVRNPEPYRQYGLSIPNGILLYGPPGCGKTYIARQLAEELGHYFVEVIPSELASPYIHQSVVRIRELFDSATEHAPSIIFIDEFEALAPSRQDLGGTQQYKSEEVNEFLAHLNRCSEKGVFVIAATNQPKKIDPAVRRTGRLDKLIYVGPPDREARKEMLIFHLRNRPSAPDLPMDDLAEALHGYSASDLQFLVDEAARSALKEQKPISMGSFVSAMERIHASVPPDIEAQFEDMEQRG
jgi:AAA+ superfamily predicted ATPase